jgi:hypothetical protein
MLTESRRRLTSGERSDERGRRDGRCVTLSGPALAGRRTRVLSGTVWLQSRTGGSTDWGLPAKGNEHCSLTAKSTNHESTSPRDASTQVTRPLHPPALSAGASRRPAIRTSEPQALQPAAAWCSHRHIGGSSGHRGIGARTAGHVGGHRLGGGSSERQLRSKLNLSQPPPLLAPQLCRRACDMQAGRHRAGLAAVCLSRTGIASLLWVGCVVTWSPLKLQTS